MEIKGLSFHLADLYYQYEIGGLLLPLFEYAIIKCMAWPLDNANGINNFVTSISMKDSIIKLLSHLSINIVEKGGN